MDDKNARSPDHELAFQKGVVHNNNNIIMRVYHNSVCIINFYLCGKILLQLHTVSRPHQSLYNNIFSCSCLYDSQEMVYVCRYTNGIISITEGKRLYGIKPEINYSSVIVILSIQWTVYTGNAQKIEFAYLYALLT